MAPAVEIVRPKGSGLRRDIFRRYKVFFDGVEVARLKEGESFRVETLPGDHELYAKVDWAQTPPVTMTLSSDDLVRFAVRPGGTAVQGLGQAMRSPQNYLVVERL